MTCHREIRLILTTVTALSLSSCAVKNGRLDFTWWQDAAAPVLEDDVIIESGGGGYYRTTPAPSRVPAASIPREKPETPPTPAAQVTPPKPVVTQQQPAQPDPPAAPKRKRPRPAAPKPMPGTHLVQPGDTLSALARRYGTTVSALVAANGMANANVPLRVNQQLKLPTAGNTPAAAPAPAAPAPPAQTTPPPAPAKPAAVTPAPAAKPVQPGGSYIIQAGDTIYKISRQYGVSPAALMQANGLTPDTANTIRTGSTLRIPAAN